MSREEIILSIIVNSFRILVIWRFMRIFFSPKAGKFEEVIIYILYFLMIMTAFFSFPDSWYNLVINLGGLILLSFLYEGKTSRRIVLSVSIYLISMACNIVASYLFAEPQTEGKESYSYGIFTVLFIYLCEIMVEKSMKGKAKREVPVPAHFLVIVPIVSILMLSMWHVGELDKRVFFVITGTGILIINMVVFLIYYQMAVYFERQIQQEHIEQQMRLYENQLDIMKQSEQKVHALRHDMKHHMQKIYQMTQENQTQDIMKYLEKMQISLENPKEHVSTGDSDLDAILNYMLEKAEKAGLTVDLKLKVPGRIGMEAYEMNIILGNLLENAIDAAKNSSEKSLSLHIIVQKGVFVARVRNSYSGKIIKVKEHFISTKQGAEHGMGLGNVRNIVEAHQGLLQIDYDEKEFQVKAMVYL